MKLSLFWDLINVEYQDSGASYGCFFVLTTVVVAVISLAIVVYHRGWPLGAELMK